jgi:hypothetical protein
MKRNVYAVETGEFQGASILSQIRPKNNWFDASGAFADDSQLCQSGVRLFKEPGATLGKKLLGKQFQRL